MSQAVIFASPASNDVPLRKVFDGDDGVGGHGTGARGNAIRNLVGVQVPGQWISVYNDRCRSRTHDRSGAGDNGESWEDYFIAWPEIERSNREVQSR